jgi:hypothetical protein
MEQSKREKPKMNLAIICIIISIILYLLICLSNYLQKDYPHSLMWFAYSLAQCAILWYEYTKVLNVK